MDKVGNRVLHNLANSHCHKSRYLLHSIRDLMISQMIYSKKRRNEMDNKKFIRWLIAICAISVVTTAVNVWLHFAG